MSGAKIHINQLVTKIAKYIFIVSIILLFFFGVITHDQELIRLTFIAGLLFISILWVAELLYPSSIITAQEEEDEKMEHDLDEKIKQRMSESFRKAAEEELTRRHENKNK